MILWLFFLYLNQYNKCEKKKMWSNQQEEALKDIQDWYKNSNDQVYRLFGYAGVGKTYIASEIANIAKTVLYGAYTGKAAHVMRTKNCKNASTIHSLIYTPVEDDDVTKPPRFVLNRDSFVKNADLIIVDEVSMVGGKVGKDLLSFGTKILVLGDPAQLKPIQGEGFFTSDTPNFMLTEVHRQAWDNPIIALSMAIRNGVELKYGNYGDSKIIPRKNLTNDMLLETDQLIVGLNKTRKNYNSYIRKMLGRSSYVPEIGDKLVCLKNENNLGIFNGSTWKTTKVVRNKDKFNLNIRNEEGSKSVKVHKEFFDGTENISYNVKRASHEFDYGYALTGHKSQGSQWDNVLIINESNYFKESKMNWEYTVITRAAKNIIMVK